MFSMCSELTPRARILDTRIPQLMQPWQGVKFIRAGRGGVTVRLRLFQGGAGQSWNFRGCDRPGRPFFPWRGQGVSKKDKKRQKLPLPPSPLNGFFAVKGKGTIRVFMDQKGLEIYAKAKKMSFWTKKSQFQRISFSGVEGYTPSLLTHD